MKQKIITIVTVVLMAAACLMMILPQLSFAVTAKDGTLLHFTTGFGGYNLQSEVTVNGYRPGILTGSGLALAGYILCGCAALLTLGALFTKGGVAAMLRVFAFICVVTGIVFIWCIIPHFDYVNDIESGEVLRNFTYEYIHMGIGSIVGGVLGSLSIVTLVASFFKGSAK